MTKLKMQDLVVVLPGITGSVLRKQQGGRPVDVWAISGQSLWRALTSLGDSLQELQLPAHDPLGSPPDTPLYADGLVNDFHGIFGLWRIDGYDRIVQALMHRFELRTDPPGQELPTSNLLSFGYDWRLSNRVSAAALQAMLTRRLAAWRQHPQGHPQAKVIVLAHSMGGLVARHWLEVLGGWVDCRALVTFGTPYLGAVEALNYLANGFKKGAGNQTLLDLTEVVRSCPSAYELLPHYAALQVQGQWLKPADPLAAAALPAGMRRHYLAAASAFHEQLATAVADNRRNADYLAAPYPVFPVVGVQQATLNSARLEGGALLASELRPDWLGAEWSAGDGTVPRYSASPEDRAQDLREVYFAERHGALQANDQVLNDLVERLANLQARRPRPMRGGLAGPQAMLSLRAEPLYLGGEPVVLSVAAQGLEHHGPPVARLTPRGNHAAPQAHTFTLKGDAYVLTLPSLPVGQYAVQVGVLGGAPGAPTPVHEVIEVAA